MTKNLSVVALMLSGLVFGNAFAQSPNFGYLPPLPATAAGAAMSGSHSAVTPSAATSLAPGAAASYAAVASPVVPQEDLIAVNYKAVDALVARLKAKLPPVDPSVCKNDCNPTQNTLIVATVVDINHLESTSTLGRLISEHVLGRLSQHGYGGIELKVRQNVYLKRNSGEFLLTRELRDTARHHNAHAVVVGTYTEAPDRVFVSIKVAEAESNRVIGAVDYVLTKSDLVKYLLASKS